MRRSRTLGNRGRFGRYLALGAALRLVCVPLPLQAADIRGLEILRDPKTGQEVLAIWNGEPGNFYCVAAENVVVVIETVADTVPSWTLGGGDLIILRATRQFIDRIPTVVTADLSCS